MNTVHANSLIRQEIQAVVAQLGLGPLSMDNARSVLAPLFTRTLSRPKHPALSTQEIYLANHSLGRPLDLMSRDVNDAMDLWYESMDGAWVDEHANWLLLIEHFRSLWAHILDLDRTDAVVPKTNAGQGLRAVLNAITDEKHVPTVVTTRQEFDSIDFVLKMYNAKGRAKIRYVEPDQTRLGIETTSASAICNAIDQTTDLVVVSQVAFSTGAVLDDIQSVCAQAHACGAYSLIDTYHGAGVIPVAFSELGPIAKGINGTHPGPDFAIGGSYKYVRGGPGACWLVVNPRHLDHQNETGSLRTLDTGWFAKKDTFRYQRPDDPLLSNGGDAWLESTPPVLTAAQSIAGLEFTAAVGVDRMRELNLKQQHTLREMLRSAGIDAYEPEIAEQFGAFTLVPMADAHEVSNTLRAHGVNTDARGGCIRFGPDVLTTLDELERAAQITSAVIRS